MTFNRTDTIPSEHTVDPGDITATEDAPSRLPAPSYAMKKPKGKISSTIASDPTAYTNYLFGSSGNFEKPAWSDSTAGRATIRLISRGIVGAIFFTLGGHLATKALKSYEPELFTFKNLGPTQTIAKIVKNPLNSIAKAIDIFPGKLISRIAGEDAVRFRPYSRFHNYDGFASVLANAGIDSTSPYAKKILLGRSLGSEIVNVTFDFFCASIGDAATRNIIQAFDPNVKQPWIIDSDGKPTARGHGHFDFGKWMQSVGRAAWRVFSYNAMEDWAAALPYVYFMKWQRQAINNIGRDPNSWAAKAGFVGDGFNRHADANNPGASVIIDKEGMRKGTFSWCGALDLHGRFVIYNWFTLMYRQAYDTIGHALKEWHKHDYKFELPTIGNPITAAIDSVVDTARYITRSFIKANIYMNPAMLFFWPMRIGQSAWKGTYEIKLDDGRWKTVRVGVAGQEVAPAFSRYQAIHDVQLKNQPLIVDGKAFLEGATSASPKFIKNITDPHDFNITRTLFNNVNNFLGAGSYNLGSWLTRRVDDIAPKPGKITQWLMKDTGNSGNLLLGREKLLRNMVDASLSYTPYMWAKAETGLRVNDTPSNGKPGPMDKAIDGFLDNAFSLKLGSAWESVKQIAKLAVVEEKSLKSREGGLNHHGMETQNPPEKPFTIIQGTREKPVAADKKSSPSATPYSMIDTKTVQRTKEATVKNSGSKAAAELSLMQIR
jgi:hypothetical protein